MGDIEEMGCEGSSALRDDGERGGVLGRWEFKNVCQRFGYCIV